MLRDLIFGPPSMPRWDTMPGIIVRSTTIDMDTARELERMIAAAAFGFPAGTYTATWQIGDPYRNVQAHELDQLSDADRARLMLYCNAGDQSTTYFAASVDMRSGSPTWVAVDIPDDAAAAAELQRQIANKITSEGTPRFNPHQAIRVGIFVPSLVLAALWLTAQLTSPLPLPAMLFGWAIVIISLVVSTIIYSRQRLELILRRTAGMRIRSETRAQTAARRADRHSNIRVTLIAAPIGILVGVIGTAITVALGLKS